MKFQPMAMQHAPLLHQLYLMTPDYFSLLGTRPPSLGEVEHDVQTALFDPRRCLELIYCEAAGGEEPIGSLDYKLNFPDAGDVTINLLMIRGDLQNSGLGQQVIRQLETRLHGTQLDDVQSDGTLSGGAHLHSALPDSALPDSALPNGGHLNGVHLNSAPPGSAAATGGAAAKGPDGQLRLRLLASVLGENPRAVAFWQRLGFSFATDARPVMTWYAKPLQPAATSGLVSSR